MRRFERRGEARTNGRYSRGSGVRQPGIEGKIEAVHFARTHRIPFLGICLGMQCAVIEFARNVLGFKDATSTEMDPATKHPVIDLMEEQKGITAKGGTMRLGAYPCSLVPGSKADAGLRYDSDSGASSPPLRIQQRIPEGFREPRNESRRCEPRYGAGRSGRNSRPSLVRRYAIPSEYKSTVQRPHPLFVAFVAAALAGKDDKKK